MDQSRFLKKFAQRVASLRKQQGLSQEELADRAGLHAVGITYIETGSAFLSSILYTSLHMV